VPDGVRVVWVGLLEESLEVVVRWPRLTLVTVGSSHDSPYVGATRLPIVAIIVLSHGHSLLRTFLHLLLLPSTPSLALWMATSNGASLPLLSVASLIPRAR
jgi:hypothetical protein